MKWLDGLEHFPDIRIIAATVDLDQPLNGRLKAIPLCERAAEEAIADAAIDLAAVDLDRFACALSGHMGDIGFGHERVGAPKVPPEHPHVWWKQWLPNTGCSTVANKYGLAGPRLCHSTACASGLISVVTAVRALRDGQCDLALAGGGDAVDPLFAAGFQRMGVLARHENPGQACRPFDRNRSGFVLGEGAAIFVLERLSHALKRGARIYAEVTATTMLAEAHHVTGLDEESETLAYLIEHTLHKAGLTTRDLGYINAHGTGTRLNDLVEMRSIRRALGPAVDRVCVSATKSILGHLIHAAGCVELAITVLAMRDGFAPPTLNLTDPDPECTFDCLPLFGRETRFRHALKLSLAFGGHFVAVALSRWDDPATGFSYPVTLRKAA